MGDSMSRYQRDVQVYIDAYLRGLSGQLYSLAETAKRDGQSADYIAGMNDMANEIMEKSQHGILHIALFNEFNSAIIDVLKHPVYWSEHVEEWGSNIGWSDN